MVCGVVHGGLDLGADFLAEGVEEGFDFVESLLVLGGGLPGMAARYITVDRCYLYIVDVRLL